MLVSYVYLSLLIFLPAILVPACASSNPAFCMMYSAYKLSNQSDNIHPWRTLFPIWNESIVPCLVLTVTYLPAYRFLGRQIRWSGIPISFRIFHSLLWSTQQYVNRELPDVQASFRKGKGTRDQIANIRWIMEKAREFQKNIYFLLYWLCQRVNV